MTCAINITDRWMNLKECRKALSWAQDTLQRSSIVSYIAKDNLRSISLAERLDAIQDPNAARPEGESKDETLVYRHALTKSPAS